MITVMLIGSSYFGQLQAIQVVECDIKTDFPKSGISYNKYTQIMNFFIEIKKLIMKQGGILQYTNGHFTSVIEF